MQDHLGDLIPKGEKMWIKARYSLKEKKHIPKGEKYLSESSHEGEVARKVGGTKGEIMVLWGGQVIIG